jgi:hypothetical protein
MPVRRVNQLLEWVRSGDYDRILQGEYVRIGQEPPVREEFDSARDHYSAKVSDAFAQAGSSIQEVGQQLGDWLERQRGKGKD